ncbi:metallophosphoesterase family protein [Thermopirellula anaerolimosa]
MAPDTLRFLHAADLHLDVPIHAIVDAPRSVVERVSGLSSRLLQRIMETAASEEVQFVLLAGDVMDWRLAGPALCEEWITFCETMAEQGVPVVWATSAAERAGPVPASLVPQGVVLLSGERPRTIAQNLENGTRVVFVHWPEGATAPDADAFVSPGSEADYVIAVRHQSQRNELPGLVPLDYWALGGKHKKETDLSGTVTRHDPGTPLARRPQEDDSSSVTVVTLHQGGACDLRHKTTGLLRWETVPLLLTETCSEAEFFSQSMQEWESRRQSGSGESLLRFVACGDPVRMIAWRREGVFDRVLGEMRARCEREHGGPWPLGIDLDPWEEWPAEWLSEDSFRGELLRQALGHAGDLFDEVAEEVRALPQEWQAELLSAADCDDSERLGRLLAVTVLERLRAAEDPS